MRRIAGGRGGLGPSVNRQQAADEFQIVTKLVTNLFNELLKN